MKGQNKIPGKQLNEVETELRIRIQNNDRGDDPGSQEKNGGKDWEDSRNVYQRLTRTKEQTELNNILKESTAE